MSDIVITLQNFKRFSKRLKESLGSQGINLSLSQSQEIFAQTLGVSSLYELQQKLEKQTTGVQPDIGKTPELLFYNELKKILSNHGSTIAKCILSREDDEFILSFHDNDETDEWGGFYFGDKKPSLSLLNIDSKSYDELCQLYDSYVPKNRHEGRSFAYRLFGLVAGNDSTLVRIPIKYEKTKSDREIEGNLYHVRYVFSRVDGLAELKRYKDSDYYRSDKYLILSGFEDLSVAKNNLKVLGRSNKIMIELYTNCLDLHDQLIGRAYCYNKISDSIEPFDL